MSTDITNSLQVSSRRNNKEIYQNHMAKVYRPRFSQTNPLFYSLCYKFYVSGEEVREALMHNKNMHLSWDMDEPNKETER